LKEELTGEEKVEEIVMKRISDERKAKEKEAKNKFMLENRRQGGVKS
jgi:hypothetical protein